MKDNFTKTEVMFSIIGGISSIIVIILNILKFMGIVSW